MNIWDFVEDQYEAVLLPPSQNIRRLSFSQKSTYFKFDQIYT
jgi:hypothetical protein